MAALETNILNQYKKGKYVQSNELNLECTTPKFNVEPETGGFVGVFSFFKVAFFRFHVSFLGPRGWMVMPRSH